LSASRPGRFNPRERDPGSHLIGWVCPRDGLDAVLKIKDSYPSRESNPSRAARSLVPIFPCVCKKKENVLVLGRQSVPFCGISTSVGITVNSSRPVTCRPIGPSKFPTLRFSISESDNVNFVTKPSPIFNIQPFSNLCTNQGR
jgi:hypothetical protein